MKGQTAVEWLVKHLSERGYIQAPSFGHSIIDKAIEQAKEMEKDQIIDFAENYEMWESENYPRKTFEQYYKETYESNN
jgi:hypothetical protein